MTRRRNGTQERLPALHKDQRRPWPLGSPPASLVLGRLVSSPPDSPRVLELRVRSGSQLRPMCALGPKPGLDPVSFLLTPRLGSFPSPGL